ncbi:Synaptogenesis protein syg-2, partial [Pseudolycoriella hygida]
MVVYFFSLNKVPSCASLPQKDAGYDMNDNDVPPERPIIYETNRREKAKNVEAYNEGSDVVLICEVAGGNPPPTLTWYLDNTVIDESYENRHDGITVNHLLYPNIGRQHVNARFVCMASNTNLTPPNNKVLILDVNLKPTAVHILSKKKFVSANKSYSVECQSSGSKPPATLTWWKGSKQIKRLIKN